MAKPYFLLFKTCVQMVLIAVGKSLQGVSPVSHGVVFTILCMAFSYMTYKIKPFNYERCNLYEVSSLVAVTYLSMVATISLAYEPKHYGWFLMLVFGWVIIGIGVYLAQKKLKLYKSLLNAPGMQKKTTRVKSLFSSQGIAKVHVVCDNGPVDMHGKPPTPADDSVNENKNQDVTYQLDRSFK